MKLKTFIFLFIICSRGVLFAQSKTKNKKTFHEEKYFLSLSYGLGQARWFSKIINADLYNPTGTKVKDGSFSFRAINRTSSLHIEVLVPVSKIRLGMGINFENFNLDKLQFKNGNNKEILYPFNESFRTDKITAIIECPINWLEKTPFNMCIQNKLGYVGYTKVSSPNLFGEAAVPRTFFAAAGVLFDYEIIKKIFLFVAPSISYNYCSTSPSDLPLNIKHTIITENLMGGIRFNAYGQ